MPEFVLPWPGKSAVQHSAMLEASASYAAMPRLMLRKLFCYICPELTVRHLKVPVCAAHGLL